MRLKAHLRLTSIALCCLLKGILCGLHVALAYLRRVKTAELSFEKERGRYGIAGASSNDAGNEESGLVIGQRAMGIVCSVEDFDSIDCLRQIFAWMSGATGDLD